MYYGISQSTDLRSPNTEVKKFTSKKAALSWQAIGNGAYTYGDPRGARNYHHTFNRVYELCGRIDKKHPIFKDCGSRDYPRNNLDNLAYYIYKYGHEVMDERN